MNPDQAGALLRFRCPRRHMLIAVLYWHERLRPDEIADIMGRPVEEIVGVLNSFLEQAALTTPSRILGDLPSFKVIWIPVDEPAPEAGVGTGESGAARAAGASA